MYCFISIKAFEVTFDKFNEDIPADKMSVS